jgi:hypothetical protein
MEKCKSCTNIDTPICDGCSFIETAKGQTTPTRYCGYDIAASDEIILEDLTAMIENRVKYNRPIPVRYVIKYNRLLEVKNNGKKENISTSQDT